MKSHIVTDFAKWKHINEAESPGRTKQTAGMGQRIVGIPIDQTSFKIKIIRDLDVLDPNGKLTQEGFNGIISWIKQQPKWLPYYPGLGDLAKNILTYSVNTDSERKQEIVFTIQPRPQGVPANTQFVHKNDLASAGKTSPTLLGKEGTGTESAPKPETSSVKIPTPLTFDQLKMLASGQPLFNLIDNAYLNMVKMPEFANLPLMPQLKKELKAGKLGDAAVSLVKGTIAGFSLVDKYGDPVENMNQQVADKLSLFVAKPSAQNSSRSYFLSLDARAIVEQTIVGSNTAQASGEGQVGTSLPDGFDLAKFTAALGTTSLGDINLPEGGLRKGSIAKGDAEFKKFQRLVIDKFAKKLANNELYKKFAKFGADGNYGPTSEKMVAALKNALGTSEKDGTVVTAELINKINTNKIDEGRYLGLDTRLVEQFDMGAFNDTVKTYKPKSTVAPKPTIRQDTTSASSSTQAGSSDAQKASDLLKNASQKIVDYYNDESNFQEYKGKWYQQDKEQAAVDEIFGSTADDPNSWWFTEIKKKYLVPAEQIINKLAINTSQADNHSLLEKELEKLNNLYSILRKKTLGNTQDDSHTWSHTALDRKKTTFTVDTDF